MLAPLSWLKEYIDITLKPQELGERLTEVGLGCEKIIKEENDTIFELEITPNRPDCLSLMGIAREIAAIEKKKILFPNILNTFPKPVKKLPLTIKTDSKINPRFTAIIMDNITVKKSPQWLQEKLMKIGQRPINNIVDITNYVMFELGNPLHAFDYDKIEKHEMSVELAHGGEHFTSVDEISYILPKDTVIIKDKEKIIDLCGIKGAQNSGTYENTKTIVIRVPVEIPVLIRKASMSLGVRSEASSIFERGVNQGGTIETLKRCVYLVQELAGGKIASDLFDIKQQEFNPWKLDLRIDRLNHILGMEIPEKQIMSILDALNLSPLKKATNSISTTIPTYRNDLKIEEDLIEEVARLYGYNNFPKTMPSGIIPTQTIPYFKDYKKDEEIKNIFKAVGFYEIYMYSLVSEKDLQHVGIDEQNALRVDNPVSKDYEYLRPTLKISLLKALSENKKNAKQLNLFEIGKVYKGKTVKDTKEEYMISAISNQKTYFEIKGIIEKLFKTYGVSQNPSDFIQSLDEGIFFEFPYALLLSEKQYTVFTHLPKYPPVIEDLALLVKPSVKVGELIKTIQNASKLVSNVSLLDQYENTKTFHIIYQDPEKNLTTQEVEEVRKKILSVLKEKFGIKLKE